MKQQTSYHIGFIGFGLIGGSIAKSLKKADPKCYITVTSRSQAPLLSAKADGVIDAIAKEINQAFAGCDYIFLCTPVETAAQYLIQLKAIKKDTCILTDVGSVKNTIHQAALKAGLSDCFIGGHPMAGSEQSGYTSSSPDLLKNAVYVLTPTNATAKEQLDSYISLVSSMGAIPLVMDYSLHDYTVAGISHVPHLAAAALSKLVQDNDDRDRHMHMLAAGGFKDTTRIAASSPEMWAQICTANRDAIGQLLDKYIAQLSQIRDCIAGDSPNEQIQSSIYSLFHAAGSYRNSFDETDEKKGNDS